MSQPTPQRHATMPAKWRLGLPFPFGPRVEDPVRISQLTEQIAQLSWKQDDQRKSLDVLFACLSDLAHAEIRYYYIRRGSSRRLSQLCRFIAWFLGTLGILVPVVKPVLAQAPDNFLSWGYVAFALAGSALVADTAFAGTEAHQRYVKTQLEVERLYTLFALEWQALLVALDVSPSSEGVVALIQKAAVYSEAFHHSLGTETAEWKVTMDKARGELRRHASMNEASSNT